MLYRLYTPRDFPQLYAIEEVCFQPPFRFGRKYMRQLVNRLCTATWIAELDGLMAGFGNVGLCHRLFTLAYSVFNRLSSNTGQSRGWGVVPDHFPVFERKSKIVRKRVVAVRRLFAIMRPWLLHEDKKRFSIFWSRL
jgi:hypothetical protein